MINLDVPEYIVEAGFRAHPISDRAAEAVCSNIGFFERVSDEARNVMRVKWFVQAVWKHKRVGRLSGGVASMQENLTTSTTIFSLSVFRTSSMLCLFEYGEHRSGNRDRPHFAVNVSGLAVLGGYVPNHVARDGGIEPAMIEIVAKDGTIFRVYGDNAALTESTQDATGAKAWDDEIAKLKGKPKGR
jgi:hypothetical protein